MNQVDRSTSQSNQINVTIEKYTQMLTQNPEAPEIHLNLGNLYAQKEQWQKSIKHYRKAIKIAPKLTDAYRNIAKAYLKIGNEIIPFIDTQAIFIGPEQNIPLMILHQGPDF